MKKVYSFIYCLLLIQVALLAQTTEENFSCAYDEEQILLKEDAAYQEKIKEYQQKYVQFVRANPKSQSSGVVYTLPTIVHIIHAGAALGTEANPTDATISTVLQQSTDRFRHTSGLTFTNTNSGVDTEIEFCLATTDPAGNYTTGVIRYYEPTLSVGTFAILSSFVESTKWDVSKYNNMYIMTDMTNAAGVYLGGTDVTVYDAGAFWSGLICHEIGHYLSLDHIFQGGCTNTDCLSDGDGVCDTPPKSQSGTLGATCANPSNSCASDADDLSVNNPYRPVANGGIGDQADMLENYMDYTGSCWAAFSQGQGTRMRFNIENNRTALTSHAATACASRPVPANEIGVTAFSISSNPCSPTASISDLVIKNYGTASLSSCVIEILVNGTIAQTLNQSVTIPASNSMTISLDAAITLSDGDNIIQVRTRLPNGQTDGFSNNDWTRKTIYYTSEGAIPPYTEAFSSSTWPSGYVTTNGNNVAWQLGASNTSRVPCFGSHFAYVIGYSNVIETAVLQLPIVDLSGLSDANLSFKYGYVQRYENIQNELSVRVVSACTNASIVWTKSDAALSTGGFSDGARIFPNCDHDEIVSIDLSSFVGEEQVFVEFIAEGQYYSGLVLDSISITSTTLTCTIPSNLSNADITDMAATVSWTGTATANTYELQYKPTNGSIWQTVDNISTTPYTLTSLTPSTSYDWRIRSQCSGGMTSDWINSGFTTFANYCPDLVVTDLQITSFSATSINYDYTIKNIGDAPVNLDGPTVSNSDNVSVQAFLSADMVYNPGDIGAGGTILGLSPLGTLASGATRSGSFGAGANVNTDTHPYLVFKVDWGESIEECDETNNSYALLIDPPVNYSNFIGHWQHEDLNTPNIPVTIIREEANQLFVHDFGKCSPTYCDHGEESTSIQAAQDGEITIIKDAGFAISYDTLRMIDETTMIRSTYRTFTDNSGRADYYSVFLMYRNDCVNHLDISLLTGDNMTYWSAHDLTSNGFVAAGKTITVKAGASVQLRPGFYAQAGSNFHAYIAPCTLSTIAPEQPIAESRVAAPFIESIQLQVLPNPLYNVANIRFYLPNASPAKVLVFNLNGELLTEQSTESAQGWNSTELDASKLPAGMYFVTLQTAKGKWTEKVMVVK